MTSSNISEELERLAKLRDSGALSDAEFEAQKKKLLAGASPAPAKSKGVATKVAGIGCLAVIVLIVIGLVAGGGEVAQQQQQAESAETKAAEPPMEVTARELFAAYDANEAAAQAQYGNRPLLVTGVVSGVDLDFSDEPVVKLRTQNEFMDAQASLIEASHAKASSLAKGQTVKLRCASVGEIMGTPMLRDCAIQ